MLKPEEMTRRPSVFKDLDEISAGTEIPIVDPSSVPKVLYGHRSSIDSLVDLEADLESRVLVLYTGGTIGMVANEKGKLAPIPNALENRIRLYPHMHDSAYASKRFSSTPNQPLVLPDCKEKGRVAYWVYEYNPLLDSCNMTMDDWIRIAIDIKKVYELFDGFVVLHGTDTMGYTASALSFMMENLGKPIVITGSQIPIFETRSDGRDNFIGSVIIAGNYDIPEVTVFFNNKLYRGNRTVKVSSGNLDAFASPNMPPLAVAAISIHVESRLIFRSSAMTRFTVMDKLNRHVVLLRIFPSISADSVRTFMQPPTSGVVLQTYGAGNIPSNRTDLIEVLCEASARGIIIVNITQCSHGSVAEIYEVGEALKEAGVLPGLDMTPEAAVTKLSYVLAKDEFDLATKKKMMVRNLRGELTILHEEETSVSSSGIIESITRALQLGSTSEIDQVKELIVPTMFFESVANSDIERMDSLWQHFTEINRSDAGGSTALHIAAKECNEDVIKWLLEKGASVHIKDNNGHTALWYAVERDKFKVISLLEKTGAHLTELPLKIGHYLVSAAATGNVQRLRSFHMADCDMNLPDTLGRTAIHAACIMGSSECVQFLLSCDVDVGKRDKTNLTPEMCAEISDFPFLVEVISEHKRLKANRNPRAARRSRQLSKSPLAENGIGKDNG